MQKPDFGLGLRNRRQRKLHVDAQRQTQAQTETDSWVDSSQGRHRSTNGKRQNIMGGRPGQRLPVTSTSQVGMTSARLHLFSVLMAGKKRPNFSLDRVPFARAVDVADLLFLEAFQI